MPARLSQTLSTQRAAASKCPRLAVGRPSSKQEQAMRAVGDSGSNATAVRREEATELGANVAGPVILPGDDGYAAERTVYNLNLPLEPALIVGVTSDADVQAAVRFAAGRGLPVAVNNTGHQVVRAARGAV